ncbi:hypothetical protein LXL04_014895 [Taraxacum kok-saghyz]
MDIGNESACQGYPVDVCFSDPKSNCKNGSDEQLAINGGIYNSFLMNNVWKSIPCSDLLALADASITTKVSGGGCGGISGGDTGLNMQFANRDTATIFMPDLQQCRPDRTTRYLFDLNSPPIATEQESITSISTPLTPLTQKQSITTNQDKQDDIELNTEQLHEDVSEFESNEELEDVLSDDFNLTKTPQPKQKRKRHRPKVVREGRPKTARKTTTPNTSTGKRKYVRKIMHNEEATVPKTRNSCRRKINFEEDPDFHAGAVDLKVLESQSLSPITPNKSERPEKGGKRTWSRAKRHIKFSENDATNDLNCSSNGQEARGTKREFESLEAYLSIITQSNNGSMPGLHFPAIYKKKRTEKCRSSITSRAVSSFQFKPGEPLISYGVKNHKSYKAFDHVGGFRKKRSKGVKRMRDLASFAGIWLDHNRRYSCMEALIADLSVKIATKKRTMRNSKSYYNHWFLTNHIGFGYKTAYDVNALINQFENLDINKERDRHAIVPYFTRYREKNGIVLYEGERGIVPYDDDEYNPLKRRKARPKVDIDEETSRVWRLLLEDINSEGIDGTDDGKAKWWEDERNVFRGRAVSFIARMHLVQGDRRFSKWKGSVVDSVTGVFLTQNVSDHASSSAFMSLAAKYPLKSKNTNEPLQEDKSRIHLEERMTWHEENPNQKLAQVLGSMTLQNSDSYEEEEEEEEEVVHSNDLIDSNSFHDQSGSEQSGISTESATQQAHNEGQESQENNHDVQKTEILSGEVSEVTESSKIGENSIDLNEVENIEIKKGKTGKPKKIKVNWDNLRISAEINGKRERSEHSKDSLDYEAVRLADVNEIADCIKDRGMNNMLAERIKAFLNRLVNDHGSIDLEWLRDVPPDKAKEYLLSFRGLGLKSVECVRLLTLHHLAFPVDTNVGRIAVRLGWVPLQPLPESLQLHLLELYPVLESIQKYLWPRLCKLDQKTLYELHYQMITFGKVFCTKNKPNCNACPMRGECRHFASAFASARLTLPAPEEKSIVIATENQPPDQNPTGITTHRHHLLPPPPPEVQNHNPIIEEPATPEAEKMEEFDMEDFGEEEEDSEEIPTIRLNMEEFTQNLQTYMENNMELEEGDVSRALVALTSEAASIPTTKLKNVSQLRTEHQVYELPDSHPLLEGLDKREPDDPCSYLLAIWTPGETAESIQPPGGQCSSKVSGTLCHEETCFSCNNIREANSQTVRGTLLIPCRTAMRGSFPLNGTYFQVNEVFADHDSSLNPIDVPRSWLWNLPRRTVYFGTSIPTIFKGLTTAGIQYCFWRGFVCVRGFDQKTRAPRPLMARLHFPVSKLKRSRGRNDED